MKTKIQIKKFLTNFGIQIAKSPHKGIDICQDINHYLPTVSVELIFDIGANIGQSVSVYQNWFPKAVIHCFEPVETAFEKLVTSTRNNENIKCHKLAFGSEDKTGMLEINSDLSVMSKISSPTLDLEETSLKKIISIKTLDSFCQQNGIDKINYMKIDTEGFDYEILIGAKQLLKTEKIDILEVEVGMYPGNEWHVPFEKIKLYLENHNYLIFGIYDQTLEWTKNQTNLRRVNAAFISSKLALSTAKEGL